MGYSSDVVERLVAVTPSNSTVVAFRAFYVGVGGDVAITDLYGATVTFKNMQAGAYYPFACTKIMATNTTATNIIGLV